MVKTAGVLFAVFALFGMLRCDFLDLGAVGEVQRYRIDIQSP